MPPDSSPRPILESLYRISSLAGKTGSTREALNRVLQEVLGATGGSSGSVALIDPDTGRLRIEVHHGLPADCADAPLKLGEGLTGWVALHGKPVLAADVSTDPRYRKLIDEVRCEVAAPIEERGQVIGVISVNSEQVGAFDEGTLQILTSLTAEAATLLSQLWLVKNLKTTAGHLQAVLTVGQGIASRLDQREILHSITRETVAMSGCHLCAIHLLDKTGTSLLPQSAAGGGSGKPHPDLPVDESSAGVTVRRKKQVEIAEVRATEVLEPLIVFAQAEGLASLLCTPLVFEDQVLGVISVYSAQTHRFSNDERNLLQAMAGLGAVAIHNARLYERVFETEETLRRREKLTTLGLIAAEIAHEVRNPLTVLKLLFESLDLSFRPEDARHRDVEIISEKLDQLEETVDRVLSFARPSEEAHVPWALEEILADTLQLLRLKFQQAGVQVVQNSAPETPAVPGDKGQLQQVFLNLLLNSLRAVEAGGRIELRTGAENSGDRHGACLEIEDTGPGIPAELRPDIFQSLLTGQLEGTGLGLGIAKRIVESHGGRIEVARTGPGGTVMKVWLPAAKP